MAQNGSESTAWPTYGRAPTGERSNHKINSANQDQQIYPDKSDTKDITLKMSKDTPKPTNTKQAAKRKKHTFTPKGTKRTSMRTPNPIGLIYRKGTDCVIADEATEKRLKPLNRGALRDMTFIW